MEKKSKSKSIFSLFALDWDDKPKHRSEKERHKERPSRATGKSDEPSGANKSQTPSSHNEWRSRSKHEKFSPDPVPALPPQPAPRTRSKSAKLEPESSVPMVKSSSSSTKRHSAVIVQRTESPFPSPHLAKKPASSRPTGSRDLMLKDQTSLGIEK